MTPIVLKPSYYHFATLLLQGKSTYICISCYDIKQCHIIFGIHRVFQPNKLTQYWLEARGWFIHVAN